MDDGNAPPLAARVVRVDLGVIDLVRRAELLDIQAADGGKDRIGRHVDVALGGREVDLRVEQFLLCVEDVEKCPLADLLFLAHAAEGDLEGLHLGIVAVELGHRRLQLRPGLHHEGLDIGSVLLDLLDAADMRVLGLAHAGLHLARRVEWDRRAGDDGGRLLLVDDRHRGRRGGSADVEAAVVGAVELDRRQQFAPDAVDGVARALLAIEGADDDRVLARRDGDRVLDRLRQPVAWRPRLEEIRRRPADVAFIGAAADLEVRAREIQR